MTYHKVRTHDGGPFPHDPDTLVRFTRRDGHVWLAPMPAGELDWSHAGHGSDIVGYSVFERLVVVDGETGGVTVAAFDADERIPPCRGYDFNGGDE